MPNDTASYCILLFKLNMTKNYFNLDLACVYKDCSNFSNRASLGQLLEPSIKEHMHMLERDVRNLHISSQRRTETAHMSRYWVQGQSSMNLWFESIDHHLVYWPLPKKDRTIVSEALFRLANDMGNYTRKKNFYGVINRETINKLGLICMGVQIK